VQLPLAVAYVNCETYNFDISPNETSWIKSHNQKCTKTQIRPFRIAYKNFPRINNCPISTARRHGLRIIQRSREGATCSFGPLILLPWDTLFTSVNPNTHSAIYHRALFHHCPSLLATPECEPTTFRSQSGDANHSAIPPLCYYCGM